MQIAIISYEILNGLIKLVKMFCFKLLKINLNTIPKPVIFDVCGYILIKLLYYIFVEDIIVNCLNLYIIVKTDF